MTAAVGTPVAFALIWALFWRFAMISVLAFGGGQAALPLIERITVGEMRWIGAQDFSAAVAFGYLTPGLVLITATFIGYQVAGVTGAAAATLGVFLMPWVLAGAAAAQLSRWAGSRWLKRFGYGAAPAVIGLLGVTTWSLGRTAIVSWIDAVVALAALGLVLRTRIQSLVVIAAGAVIDVRVVARSATLSTVLTPAPFRICHPSGERSGSRCRQRTFAERLPSLLDIRASSTLHATARPSTRAVRVPEHLTLYKSLIAGTSCSMRDR